MSPFFILTLFIITTSPYHFLALIEAQVEERIRYSVTVEDPSTRSAIIRVNLEQVVQPAVLDFEYVYLFGEPVICPEGAECDSYMTDVTGLGTEEYEMKGLVPAEMYKYKFYLRNLITGDFIIEDTTGNQEIEVQFCTKPGLPNIASYEGKIYSVDGQYSECVTVNMEAEKENVKYKYTIKGGSYETVEEKLSNELTYCVIVSQKSEKADIEVQLVINCEEEDVAGDPSAFVVEEFKENEGDVTVSPGQPVLPVDITEITNEWLSKSIVRVSWTTTQESYQSQDYFVVWLNRQVVANGSLEEKTFSIDKLSLCDTYYVVVQAFFRGRPGQSQELYIRNWDKSDGIKEILENYPNALEECGKCSNIEKTKLCSFPFTWNNLEYNTCTTRIRADVGEDKELNCLTLTNEQISCASDLPQCLPPEPTLSGLSISTKDVGFVAVSWEASSDELSFYKIYLNGEEVETTTASEYDLMDLEPGKEYEFEVRVDSFGRIGKSERISFVASDQKENAFAVNQTTESADIIWDTGVEAEPEDIETNVAFSVEEKPLLKLLLGDAGLNNLSKTFDVDQGSTKLAVGNLVAGVKYSVIVTKTVGGETNATLETAVTTVPRPLEQTENSLVLYVNNMQGIDLTGLITSKTYSEKLNFLLTVVCVSAIVETDGEYNYIAAIEESQNHTKDACLTEDCVKPETVEFERAAFVGILTPGCAYEIKVVSQTGNAEAEMESNMCHVERPNPIALLRAYSVTANEIRLSWGPPPTGPFLYFLVVYMDHLNNLIEERKDGYLRHSADNLIPGYSYTFEVFALAEAPNCNSDIVQSDSTQLQQDAAPMEPEGVESTQIHPFTENKFRITVDPPTEGLWDHFVVVYDDLHNPVGEKVFTFAKDSLSGEIQFDRYGIVHQLEVRSVSKNGVKSRYPVEHRLLTDPKEIESEDVEIIEKNDNELCYLWKLDKNNSNYNRVTGTLLQTGVEVAKEESVVDTQQTSGVLCFDLSEVSKEIALLFELKTTAEDPDGILQPRDVINYPLNPDFNSPDVEYTLGVESTCEPGKCMVTIDADVLPLEGLLIKYRLVKQDNTRRSRRSNREITGEFNGSDCPTGFSACTFIMDNLPTGSYQMFVTVIFYGVQIKEEGEVEPPIVPSTTEEPKTTEEPETTEVPPPGGLKWYYYVAAGVGVIIVLAIVVAIVVATVVWARTRKLKKHQPPASSPDPLSPHPDKHFGQRDSGDYDKPKFEDDEYQEPNFEDGVYDEPKRVVCSDLNTDYFEVVDYQDPSYANHIYDRTMQVAHKIGMRSEYVEASLNPAGLPIQAGQVEVQVGMTGGQGDQDETHDPRYV